MSGWDPAFWPSMLYCTVQNIGPAQITTTSLLAAAPASPVDPDHEAGVRDALVPSTAPDPVSSKKSSPVTPSPPPPTGGGSRGTTRVCIAHKPRTTCACRRRQ
ncbi:hypothetical protein BRADI_3g56975v3 [Brachypodium distachyon]|uniref:Uncharacterized protein n=1 Tax=Brachypodium distachyon TaxID=15368 RepID=A0A0Q3FQF0_BRADI|nr:hypothetical protein BRADI_3g56975v3 [Brachypodium distachyon]